MSSSQIAEFTDASTPLDQAHLNTGATAKSALLTGSIPASSGSLVITLGALTFIVNSNGTAVEATAVTPAPITIAGGASSTNYVFINGTGALAQSTSNTPPSGYATLLSAVVNGGNTAITTITQLMSAYGEDSDTIGADLTEAATADVLTIASSLRNSLNRIRKAITNINGSTFSAAVAAAGDVIVGRVIRTGSGGVPTLTVLASGATTGLTANSTDQAGEVFGTGNAFAATPQALALVRVTFSSALPNAPFVQITPDTIPAANNTPLIFFVANVSSTKFEIWAYTASAAGSAGGWGYNINYSLSTP